jgi:hypothetical protein
MTIFGALPEDMIGIVVRICGKRSAPLPDHDDGLPKAES